MATSIKRSKGSQSSLRIGTYSYWIRIATANDVSGGFNVYSNTVENDNNRGYFQFTSAHKWRMVDNDSSGTHIQLRTNRAFKDLAGWYLLLYCFLLNVQHIFDYNYLHERIRSM